MTLQRRLARAGFTLTRDYPAPVERIWDAFTQEDQKLAWWGAGDAIEPGEWAFDVRVGGRDVAEGTFHDGPVSRYEATYTDIVEHNRIVTTYDMLLDGVHTSTSVASLKFEPTSRAHGSRTSSTAFSRPVLGRRAQPRERHSRPTRRPGQLPRLSHLPRWRWLSNQTEPASWPLWPHPNSWWRQIPAGTRPTDNACLSASARRSRPKVSVAAPATRSPVLPLLGRSGIH